MVDDTLDCELTAFSLQTLAFQRESRQAERSRADIQRYTEGPCYFYLTLIYNVFRVCDLSSL